MLTDEVDIKIICPECHEIWPSENVIANPVKQSL